MSIFQRSVTCSFFQELYSHIDKNSGEKFEDMFLVKTASKGTSLIRIKGFCVRKFDGLARSKILGILQTEIG